MYFDPILLARIQFAFTISFHIIFPAFTIGLASFLAMVEFLWLKTGDNKYYYIYKLWVKIFALAFGMGVVSGVVMAYQIGTNWSIFSDKVANVLGPLFGFEVLTAFFLEASFLGIMLFGWGRVSKKMHFASSLIVAIGTNISAFWILSVNSWMQTPQGYEMIADGRLMPTNWLEIIFNPSFPFRYAHMVTAAYLTTSFVVGGVGAFYLFKKRHIPEAKIMLGMAVIMASIVTPIQLCLGDAHGLNTKEHQPAKIAAMEGLWHTRNAAPLVLFAIPNEKEQRNDYEISIPYLSSLILTHSFEGQVRGLNEFINESPPVLPVFFAFRIMVMIGFLMLFTGLVSAFAYYKKILFENKYIHILWMMMMPSGFIAILAGWMVTEIGRQPYVVYGVIRTASAVTPSIVGPEVAWSLLSFVIMYSFVFGFGSYYILKLIFVGINSENEKNHYYSRGIQATITKNVTKTGE